ncbi:MAG: hypothetical protein ABL896_06330 [Hylemonella sp.]
MKKIAVSIAFAAMVIATHAQSMETPAPSAAASSAVARFVDQPYNCMQMLGGGNDGDTLPTSYNVALDASLKEINAPVDQAFAQLNARCAMRVSDTSRVGAR